MRHEHEHELGSKVGLGRVWACVREERRRDRDRMVRLALSPLLPRFPLLPVSCHAVPSSSRLPPAVPRCANEPLGGQRGDYDGATLADLAVRTETVGFDWLAPPSRVCQGLSRPGRLRRLAGQKAVVLRSPSGLSLPTCYSFSHVLFSLSFLIERVTTVWTSGHPCHNTPAAQL